MTAALREIRFFLEHGIRYPLWESFTDKYAMDPWDFDLSDDLSAKLREYMRFWSSHFTDAHNPNFEWDSAENEQHYWDEGDRLLEQLRSEVEGIALVNDERYWTNATDGTPAHTTVIDASLPASIERPNFTNSGD